MNLKTKLPLEKYAGLRNEEFPDKMNIITCINYLNLQQ